MCLFKVYADDPNLGKRLIAENIAFISKGDGFIKIVDIESKEKIVTNVEILSIDALNSTLILKQIQ